MLANELCNIFFLIIFVNPICIIKALEPTSKVHCNKEFIDVQIIFPGNDQNWNASNIYMQSWPNIPLEKCQALQLSEGISLRIFLNDFHKCGLTRVLDKRKLQVTFSQNLIVAQRNHPINSTINIKCSYKINNFPEHSKHKIIKRDTLPDDFKEDEDIEIVDSLQQQAPQPQVLMEVRQNNQLVNGMVTVIPGTPLIMEVKLNDEASSIYGLNINFLEVSDTRDMSETIIFRGCTVDPYLFENFNVSEGHRLKSKFRAFKFPNTAFVQFRANVQICLKKCPAPQCTSGQQEERRKKREVLSKEDNHIYDVSLNLLLKFDQSLNSNKDVILKLQKHMELLKMKNLILRKLY